MTLDEAIKHAEEVAIDQDLCCSECAEEHRQLAEWLKDYKQLLEQQPCDDCVSRKAMLNAITEIDNNVNMDIYTNEVREIIEALPPVTPTHGTCEYCLNHGIDKQHEDIDGARYCSSFHTYTGYDFYCADYEKAR